jgi:hypothetical protein
MGTDDFTPAAASGGLGPAMSAFTAPRAPAAVEPSVRVVNQRRAERLNQTLMVDEACGLGPCESARAAPPEPGSSPMTTTTAIARRARIARTLPNRPIFGQAQVK